MSRGQFFTIDRRTWGFLCDRNDLNAAAAYLVLATGTGVDNRGTSWSVQSLKEYAGISFERGKAAIKALCDRRLIRHAESSTRTKPRYELLTYAEINAHFSLDTTNGLDGWRRGLLENIKAGKQPSRRSREDIRAAKDFVSQGLLRETNGIYSVP